jgi:hypothetical protein
MKLFKFSKLKIQRKIVAILITIVLFLSTNSVNGIIVQSGNSGGRNAITLTSSNNRLTEDFKIDNIILDLPSLSFESLTSDLDSSQGWSLSCVTKAPQLPTKKYSILLPPDVDPRSVKISVLEDNLNLVSGEYFIPQAPVPVALLEDQIYFAQNENIEDVYSIDKLWPNNIIQNMGVKQLRNARILEFYYYPIQYNPVLMQVCEHKDVKISIDWEQIEAITIDPLTQRYLSDYRDLINNYDDLAFLYDIQAADIPSSTYVIVTTNDIAGNSTALDDFVRFKQAAGFEVRVITEDDFGYATGKQRVLNIRSWLQSHYVAESIEYVLLIGNPDPDDETAADPYGDIPMLMCWPRYGMGSYDRSPTDYFYADLTGNWNTDGDSYYGEHGYDTGVDFYPEVYVGRIPVYYEQYSDLDNILLKIINHHTNAGAEKNQILEPMAISNYDNEDNTGRDRTDGLDVPEEIFINIANPLGMTDAVFYEAAGLSPVPPSAFHYSVPLTDSNFISEFNNGYGAVFWWGHGSDDSVWRKYWANDLGPTPTVPEASEMVWDTFLHSDNMSLLEDDQPAFFYQASCHNGYPEYSNNLGYALLKRGAAISTVSASRVSWYLIGLWNHTYWWSVIADNVGIGYFYMENLLVGGYTSGAALYLAKASGGDGTYAESWMNKMDFNLYGDPQQDYWGSGRPNSPINISPYNMETGVDIDCNLSVDVSDPDGGYLNVAFYDASDDSLIGVDLAVASGGTAWVNWTGLTEGATYQWYVVIGDGQVIRQSATMQFTAFVTNPTWDETPTNQIAYYNVDFYYNLNATDASGISSWWINDTVNFDVNAIGEITNKTVLLLGETYGLEVRAYDPYSHYCFAMFKITVEELIIPEYKLGFSLIILSLSVIVTTAIFSKRFKFKKIT